MVDGAGATQVKQAAEAGAGDLAVPPHKGLRYERILGNIHTMLRPKSYVEIGVATGKTLRLAECPSIGVDPKFDLAADVMGSKPLLALRQCGSDEFFAGFDPRAFFGRSHVDFFFLDGMHLFEFLLRDFINAERFSAPNTVIAMHDCLPYDVASTRRVGDQEPQQAATYPGGWTGDVWRVLPVLKRYRPGLRIHCLDAAPTGLVLITGLDPSSRLLTERYHDIVEEALALDLGRIGVKAFLDGLPLREARGYNSPSSLSRHFWL